MFYSFAKWLTYVLVRLFFNMRYEGLEYIPKGGGYILCSNHRTNWDPVVMIHKIPSPVYFMAKSELFKNKLFGAAISALNAFPIERGKGDTGALDKAAEIIKDGGVLLIFPEGHRFPDGIPGRARSGVSVLSAKTGASVLCCSIDYGKKMRFRTSVTMRYHPVLELNISQDSPSQIRAGAKRVMETIESGLTVCREKQLKAGEK